MEMILISCFIYFFKIVNCVSDSESAESNRIEVTPFYDTIIFSDIADIINDFENSGFSAFNAFVNSESQSDEKTEDLLTEYQHHLEKAHKQRKSYMEKLKTKNKVPLLRHDQFTKPKPGEYKHNNYYYPNSFYNPSVFKLPQSSYNDPLDIFIPVNSKGKHMNNLDLTTTPRGNYKESHVELFPFDKIIFNDKKILDLPPMMRKPSSDPIKSSCYCKNGQVPCDCNCKQCLIHIEPVSRDQQTKLRSLEDQKPSNMMHSALYDSSMKIINDDSMKELAENTLNIRIKIDLQLPKLQEQFGKYKNHINHEKAYEPDDIISKELTTAIKLPFPYFNFPMPMDVISFKKPNKYNKDDSMPLHKITIHKKKKSRTNNNNKKHRKKIITFHNIKLQQQPLFPIRFNENLTDLFNNSRKNSINNNTTIQSKNPLLHFELNPTVTNKDEVLNNTQTEENIYLMLNISSNMYNTTEDNRKFENSIEADYTKLLSNGTTKLPTIRDKRETLDNKQSNDKLLKKDAADVIKEKSKNLLSDAELLYWPVISRNESIIIKKNITSLILENEHKKTKLNMSKESLRQNHTRVLEQAIFGDVDWDDIDAVAPAFMSFVGKYVNGILTFCSQRVCHSMKCANKTCLHRICVPSDRLNNKGHCAGSSTADSVAIMESIMDLPSNIAFEIVDILQNKMLGKIFGKATFCINSKCITLVASKKTFIKSRCTIKELNTTGHCSNGKTVKNM